MPQRHIITSLDT